VICLDSLQTELDSLTKNEIAWAGRFFISDRAHLLFNCHKIVDGLRETRSAKEGKSIGTTKQGIGPCYQTKAGRIGIRGSDLLDFDETFVPKFKGLIAQLQAEYGDFEINVEKEIETYRGMLPILKPMIIDGVLYLNTAIKAGKKVLIESANAIMLDLDFGTYPYVTSSSPSIGGVCTGLGIPPRGVGDNVIGIVKAYTTRVGEGPFLSEELGEEGLKLQTIGHEVGTTTGRKRRCGWLDIPQLRYSTMINGYTQLTLTKLDVLDSFKEIKIVTAYQHNGQDLPSYPSSLKTLTESLAAWKVMPGWEIDITKVRTYADLPQQARDYIEFIEAAVGVPITVIGVGPARDEVVFKK